MNDTSAAIFGCLPLILWLVVIAFGCTWLASHLMPRNIWLRRGVKGLFRLTLIEPFRQTYRAARWLTVRLFTTNREYRFHQVYLDNYPVTPLELYAQVAEVLARRQIIGVQITRVTRLEWHLFSPRRLYLLIRFRDAVCFISGVPMGTGLYVTWRYSAMPGKASLILFQIPFLGVFAERLIAPPTFYRTDVYQAFEEAVRSAVMEATNLLTQRGIRPLTDNEQRPLLREFYR